MNLAIPTTEDIQNAVRVELQNFFSNFELQPKTEDDESDIGKGAEFASRITGKAVPTIYDLVSKRLIPHFKQGKDLYFSKKDLIQWLKDGKRKTQSEIADEAKQRN